MAPGSDGTLFAAIPRTGAWVLAHLDRTGRPRAGWPILVKDAGRCGLMVPTADGGVRLVCEQRAYAFDSVGRPLPGWPAKLPPGQWTSGRMIGDELALFGVELAPPAQWMTTVAADGAVRRGKKIPGNDRWGFVGGEVGSGGIAVGVEIDYSSDGSSEMSRLTALNLSGTRAGWPITINGIASGPVFPSAGRVVLTVGSHVQDTSRVVVVDPRTKATSWSQRLAIRTAESGVDCVPAYVPEPPLVAGDGKIFIHSLIDAAIFALDPQLAVLPGWPYHRAAPLVQTGYAEGDGLRCLGTASPAVSPDGVLYLPLGAGRPKVGGTLVAVGPNGRVRAGWPVELQRPGAAFWSVTVGADGTAYALAIEPEPSGASSATILAIAPDSSILYRTTIIDQ